jgi:ZIP family zinc transporter
VLARLDTVPCDRRRTTAAPRRPSQRPAPALLNPLLPHSYLLEEPGIVDRTFVLASYLTLIGLVLHDVPEGFAMAHAFLASPGAGLVVAASIALHNIPEEFAIAASAVALRRRGLLFRAALVSASAEPAGVAFGLATAALAPGASPLLTAAAAGAMVFVAASEFAPMARAYGPPRWFAAESATSAATHALTAMSVPASV